MEEKQLQQLNRFIQDFRAGNRHALLQIYDATCSTVYLYAKCFFSSEHSIHKFITRIYQEISKKRDSIPDADVLSTWISELCFQNFFQILDRKGEYIDFSNLIFSPASKPEFEKSTSSIRDFDKETSAMISARLLNELPSFSRAAVYAYYMDNLYIAAIAHAMQESKEQLEMLIFSSVNRLQMLYHQKESVERNLFYPFTLALFLETLLSFKNSSLIPSSKKTEIREALCRLLSLDPSKAKTKKPLWFRPVIAVSGLFACGIVFLVGISFFSKKHSPDSEQLSADILGEGSFSPASSSSITEIITPSSVSEYPVSLPVRIPDFMPEETASTASSDSISTTGSSISPLSIQSQDSSGTETIAPTTNSNSQESSAGSLSGTGEPSNSTSYQPSVSHEPEAHSVNPPEVPQPDPPSVDPPQEPTIEIPSVPQTPDTEPELSDE